MLKGPSRCLQESQGEPRGERDVIRLRNPTEDKRAFRRMLTSADLTTRRPPSCLQSGHFRFYPPPPVTVIFGLFSIFVFLDYENQKTIFISDFIITDTVSRSFVTHE